MLRQDDWHYTSPNLHFPAPWVSRVLAGTCKEDHIFPTILEARLRSPEFALVCIKHGSRFRSLPSKTMGKLLSLQLSSSGQQHPGVKGDTASLVPITIRDQSSSSSVVHTYSNDDRSTISAPPLLIDATASHSTISRHQNHPMRHSKLSTNTSYSTHLLYHSPRLAICHARPSSKYSRFPVPYFLHHSSAVCVSLLRASKSETMCND